MDQNLIKHQRFIRYLKKQDDSGVVFIILKEIVKTLIEQNLLLPFWKHRLKLPEFIRLGHNGKNMSHCLLFIERRNWSATVEQKYWVQPGLIFAKIEKYLQSRQLVLLRKIAMFNIWMPNICKLFEALIQFKQF